jgi:hypothetical protein
MCVLVAGLILAVVCVVGCIAFVVLDRNATINRGARVFRRHRTARKPHVRAWRVGVPARAGPTLTLDVMRARR